METRILIVSKDSYLRNQLYQILYTASYDCYLASTRLAASVICKMFTPDVIMIDIILPFRDIAELLKMVPADCSCNVIAIKPNLFPQPLIDYDIKYNLSQPLDYSSTMNLFSTLPNQPLLISFFSYQIHIISDINL